MSSVKHSSDLGESVQEDQGLLSLQPLLEYGRLPWMRSSQRAADLYNSGAKLWTKDDLSDIERQFSQCYTTKNFIVRRVDGTTVQIPNPMYGVARPIWKPRVKFQEYWTLVHSEPDGPLETYYCSYLVDWRNQTHRQFEMPIKGYKLALQEKWQLWNESVTCESFKKHLRELLGTRKVNKVVCFGLGDLTARPPCWWRIQNNNSVNKEPEIGFVEGSMMQHWAALTLADMDPQFTNETKEIVRLKGFEIVGQYGAGGFAEVDDETVVFSPFAQAPVAQIIADIARPAIFIIRRCDENLDEDW
ncbi:hypothetical protein TOPH_06197 [Tolypocladium ophioglossoides CBS 100239]|uniref:SRR1-like domain-containing protein n=1 Tax=Tolypocladium ophioglossoides (strain CBS 100239) TaxID=1163406 RepID=A0A0L0N534_TOLOC|nr:hypothetical protein TOPH_06197 [Tolypocladium ophioglossoides CBS 100239]